MQSRIDSNLIKFYIKVDTLKLPVNHTVCKKP